MPNRNEKPTCKLSGADGNVFNIIGLVARSLRKAGKPEAAAEWQKQAVSCRSYEAVLALAFEFVEVV